MFGAIIRLSLFALKQCIIKQLLDSVFVISEIIKVSVSVISRSRRLRLITIIIIIIIIIIIMFYSAHVVVYIGFLNSQISELFLVTFTSILIIPDITKTSSNNCLCQKYSVKES